MFAQTAIHIWTREAATVNPSALPEDLPLRSQIRSCQMNDPLKRPTAGQLLEAVKTEMQWATHQPCTSPEPVQTYRKGRRGSLPNVSSPAAQQFGSSPYVSARSHQMHPSGLAQHMLGRDAGEGRYSVGVPNEMAFYSHQEQQPQAREQVAIDPELKALEGMHLDVASFPLLRVSQSLS